MLLITEWGQFFKARNETKGELTLKVNLCALQIDKNKLYKRKNLQCKIFCTCQCSVNISGKYVSSQN